MPSYKLFLHFREKGGRSKKSKKKMVGTKVALKKNSCNCESSLRGIQTVSVHLASTEMYANYIAYFVPCDYFLWMAKCLILTLF